MSATNETIAPAPMELRVRRAIYRATHRGTKELDWLIGRFVEKHVAGMSDGQMDLLERFLTVPDPELHAWIMKPGEVPASEFAGLVGTIKAFHGIDR